MFRTDYFSTFRLGTPLLHKLGVRAMAEFLAEIVAKADRHPEMLSLLVDYERLTRVMLRRTGGDRLPPRRLLGAPS